MDEIQEEPAYLSRAIPQCGISGVAPRCSHSLTFHDTARSNRNDQNHMLLGP